MLTKIKTLFFMIPFCFLMSVNLCEAASITHLKNLLGSIEEKFLGAENFPFPPAGYSVIIHYEKVSGRFAAEVHSYGNRIAGTKLPMPFSSDCPFCFEGDLKIIRSNSNRALLIPSEHIPHWFAASKELQTHLLLSAIEAAEIIENLFPGILTTEREYLFELHVGTAANQTIPHLHLRFASGPLKGMLTEEQWEWLKSAGFL